MFDTSLFQKRKKLYLQQHLSLITKSINGDISEIVVNERNKSDNISSKLTLNTKECIKRKRHEKPVSTNIKSEINDKQDVCIICQLHGMHEVT